MIEVWKIDPTSWLIDKNGDYAGPVRIRLVSRHRKAHRALEVVNGRDIAAFTENGDQICMKDLLDMVLDDTGDWEPRSGWRATWIDGRYRAVQSV